MGGGIIATPGSEEDETQSGIRKMNALLADAWGGVLRVRRLALNEYIYLDSTFESRAGLFLPR